MAKVRVYELAKEFGVESKVVVAKLQELGEFVRSASSTIEAPVVRKLTDAFQQGSGNGRSAGRPAAPKKAAPRPAAPSPAQAARPAAPRPPAAPKPAAAQQPEAPSAPAPAPSGPVPGPASDAGPEARAASGPRRPGVHRSAGCSGRSGRLDSAPAGPKPGGARPGAPEPGGSRPSGPGQDRGQQGGQGRPGGQRPGAPAQRPGGRPGGPRPGNNPFTSGGNAGMARPQAPRPQGGPRPGWSRCPRRRSPVRRLPAARAAVLVPRLRAATVRARARCRVRRAAAQVPVPAAARASEPRHDAAASRCRSASRPRWRRSRSRRCRSSRRRRAAPVAAAAPPVVPVAVAAAVVLVVAAASPVVPVVAAARWRRRPSRLRWSSRWSGWPWWHAGRLRSSRRSCASRSQVEAAEAPGVRGHAGPSVGGVMLPRGNGEAIRLSRGASLTDFAEKINANPASLVAVMMNLGEMVTATQSVSDETLQLLAGEMNYGSDRQPGGGGPRAARVLRPGVRRGRGAPRRTWSSVRRSRPSWVTSTTVDPAARRHPQDERHRGRGRRHHPAHRAYQVAT